MDSEENCYVAVFDSLWFDSFGLWRRQQNPAPEACLLPLLLVGFMGSVAEAAKILLLRHFCCLRSSRASSGLRRWQQKSCFQGAFAAFALRELHRVFGGGSKNPASEAPLLPSVFASFLNL